MYSILIVDDDINLCLILNEELNEIGYLTEFVTSADDAMTKLSSDETIDLVLLDLKMPEKDGFHVLRHIQDTGLDVRVIVLTAFADIKAALTSARLGADDFISKPYDLDELLITIRKVMQTEKYEN